MLDRILLQLFRPISSIIFRLLDKYSYEKKNLPLWYFYKFSKVAAFAAFELLVLRQNKGRWQVLLIKRPEDDPYWPGQWHNPGKIIRRDDSIDQVYQRLAKELNMGYDLPSKPILLKNIIGTNKRGTTIFMIHAMEVSSSYEPVKGTFHDLVNLPDNLIESCRLFINQGILKEIEAANR